VTDRPPVLLVHGLASSFEHNWRATGWVDLLEAEGRAVIGADLPGHGRMSAQDPAAMSPAQAVLAALAGHEQADAVGFSAGGQAVLAAAAAAPQRFRRIAVLGVGDRTVLPPQGAGGIGGSSDLRDTPRDTGPGDGAPAGHGLAAALDADDEPPPGTFALIIRRLTQSAGNDRHAVAAFVRARHGRVTLADVARITAPTLLVLGDRDFAAPAGALHAAMPGAELVTLRGVDHFATPSNYGCIDAVLRFLDR
jgi:pimeloyl-ACP methyl ester carboxylesterase